MTMIVRVAQTFLGTAELGVDLKRSHAVVVDVLRATTNMVIALDHGAREILPAATLQEARRLHDSIDHGKLLAGERSGQRVPGFDIGNAPSEFSPRNVHGKTIVMATTNGTRALHHCADSLSVTIGALRNAQALARFQLKNLAARSDEAPDPLVIVCAGTDERYSQDDMIGAGSILDAMIALNGSIEIDDAGLTAIDLYRHHADDLAAALARTTHGKRLDAIGFGEDLQVAAEDSTSSMVPVMQNGKVVPLPPDPKKGKTEGKLGERRTGT